MNALHVQGNTSGLASAGSSVSVTLSSAPTPGNMVCVGVIFFNGSAVPTLTVSDGNSNSYQVTPNSPAQVQVLTSGIVYLAYLLHAPSNASATITASFSSTISGGGALISADEFNPNGIAAFDVDSAGSGSIGTTVNTPSITPAGSGELLYSYATPGSGDLTAQSPWTQNAFGTDANGGAGEYILSAPSGATAVNYTQSTSGAWDAMAMAFSVSSPPEEDSYHAKPMVVKPPGFLSQAIFEEIPPAGNLHKGLPWEDCTQSYGAAFPYESILPFDPADHPNAGTWFEEDNILKQFAQPFIPFQKNVSTDDDFAIALSPKFEEDSTFTARFWAQAWTEPVSYDEDPPAGNLYGAVEDQTWTQYLPIAYQSVLGISTDEDYAGPTLRVVDEDSTVSIAGARAWPAARIYDDDFVPPPVAAVPAEDSFTPVASTLQWISKTWGDDDLPGGLFSGVADEMQFFAPTVQPANNAGPELFPDDYVQPPAIANIVDEDSIASRSYWQAGFYVAPPVDDDRPPSLVVDEDSANSAANASQLWGIFTRPQIFDDEARPSNLIADEDSSFTGPQIPEWSQPQMFVDEWPTSWGQLEEQSTFTAQMQAGTYAQPRQSFDGQENLFWPTCQDDGWVAPVMAGTYNTLYWYQEEIWPIPAKGAISTKSISVIPQAQASSNPVVQAQVYATSRPAIKEQVYSHGGSVFE